MGNAKFMYNMYLLVSIMAELVIGSGINPYKINQLGLWKINSIMHKPNDQQENQ